MNASTRRLLLPLAIVLALANAVLLVLWLQRTPVPVTPSLAVDNAPAPTGAAVAGSGDSNAVPVAVPHDGAGGAAPASAASSEPAVVFGTVRWADGEPCTQGMVFLMGGVERRGGQPIQQGAFAIAGFAPGTYSLSTRIEDALPITRSVVVTGGSTRVDLVLPAARNLTIKAVAPDGVPLPRAMAERAQALGVGLTAVGFRQELAADLPLSRRPEARAGIGVFRGPDPFRTPAGVSPEVLGVLTLPAGETVHVALVLRSAVLAQQLVEPGQAEVVFTVAPEAVSARMAKVRLRTVDAACKAVAGSAVSFDGAQAGPDLLADEHGRIEITNLLPGVMGLSARGQGLAAPAMLFDIPPGADIDLGDVILRDSRNVTFRVTGQLAGGERITLQTHILDGLHPRSSRPAPQGASMEGGRAETALTAGRHAVYVHSGERVALFELDTATVTDQPIDVALQPGALLRVRCSANERSGRVLVRSAWGAIVLDTELDASWERTFAVPAGAYLVEALVGNEPPRRSQLLVPDGGADLVVP